MPEPNVPNPTPAGSSQASDWLDNIPGGDTPFDDLFTPTADPVTPPAPAASASQEPPAAAPSAVPEPFLKAGSTVYKTREEAERSLAYKDEVVERLRQIEIQRTGIDPLTGKAVPPTPQGPTSYRQNQKAYFDDLVAAITKQDPTKYFETQQKFVYDALEPIAPIITEFTKQQAVATVGSEIKEFPAFLRSKEYGETLDALPELKGAIEMAEQDVNFASRLPQLYKTAYWATQGRKTPELVSTAVHTAQAQQNIPPTARPTTTPATMVPPVSGAPASLATSEGRKAIREQLGAKLADVKW